MLYSKSVLLRIVQTKMSLIFANQQLLQAISKSKFVVLLCDEYQRIKLFSWGILKQFKSSRVIKFNLLTDNLPEILGKIEDLNNLDLFGSRQILIVSEIETLRPKDLKQLLRSLSRLKCFSAILEGNLSTEISEEDIQKSAGLIVKLKPLMPIETSAWFKEFLSFFKIKISPDALSDLIAGTKNDFNQIFQLVRLLILSGQKDITQETLVPFNLPKVSELSVAESFFEKPSFATFVKLTRQDPFMQAIVSIQLKALRLLTIKLEKGRKLFSVAPFWFRKQSAGLIDKWSTDELFEVLIKALKAEEEFKTHPICEKAKIYQFAQDFLI